MTSISSLVYSGYATASSRALSGQTSSSASVSADEAEESGTEDPIAEAFANADAVGEDLRAEWDKAQAKAKLVYQLITGGELNEGDKQDLITEMLLTAYDELHVSESGDAQLEDMPAYALALQQFAQSNGVSSLFSVSA